MYPFTSEQITDAVHFTVRKAKPVAGRFAEFAEAHPVAVRIAAAALLLMAADVYAEVHAWAKGIEQIKVSEGIGG